MRVTSVVGEETTGHWIRHCALLQATGRYPDVSRDAGEEESQGQKRERTTEQRHYKTGIDFWPQADVHAARKGCSIGSCIACIHICSTAAAFGNQESYMEAESLSAFSFTVAAAALGSP